MNKSLWTIYVVFIFFNTSLVFGQNTQDIIKVTITKPKESKSSDLITGFINDWSQKMQIPLPSKSQFPNGTQKSASPKNCQPFIFEKELSQAQSPKNFSEKLNALFSTCESSWQNMNTPGIPGLLEFASAEYNFAENSKIQSIDFEFKNGFHLKGFIATKDFSTKRPWVLIKCGVFCAAEESASMRNFMMNLFDESPFNVLILGNRTGEDFIKDNQIVSVGGLYESADFFVIANWLKKHSLYGNTVSSLHVLGISLGGSASIMAEKYHSLYENDPDDALISSYLAICPVVDLEPTIQNMFAPGLKGEIFSRLTWNQLMNTKNRLSEDKDLFKSSRRPTGEEFVELFSNLGVRAGLRMQSNANYFGKHPHVASIPSYWSLSNFTEQAQQIDKPLFVWASKDDMIVSNKINTESLAKTGLINSQNLALTNVNYGNHCGFATAYGHSVTSSILRSFILSQSPEFNSSINYHVKDFKLGKSILGFGETHLRQIWTASENSQWVKLQFELYSTRGESCLFNLPNDKYSECKTSRTQKIKISDLPIKIDIPKTKVEALALNRYLNTHLKLFYDNSPIELTENEPNKILWRDEDTP